MAAWLLGCGGSASSSTLSCATGTHADQGKCVVTVACGPGTVSVSGACLPDGSAGSSSDTLDCGPGTLRVGNQCLALIGEAGAGSGGGAALGGDAGAAPTAGESGAAERDAGLSCGSGTQQVGNFCVPELNDAGAPEPGSDAGLAGYIVRVGVTSVGADGYSAIQVFVIGTNPNYNAATDSVVLGLERPGAGSLSQTALKPGPTGTTVYFTPCTSASNAFCVGKQRITLALAAAPSVVVAESQEFTLVAPSGVGSDSPCLTGGNVIFYNGDSGSYIYAGKETITQGAWSASATASEVHISVDPSDQSQGLWWDLYFDASKLQSTTLQAQVYENAQRWPFQAVGHPGLDVSGDGKGCNEVTGRFQIEELTMNGSTLQSFTATFEHHCEGGAPALRGCVHFQQ